MIFKITDIKKEFNNVSRIYGRSNINNVSIEADIHDNFIESLKVSPDGNNENDIEITFFKDKNDIKVPDYEYISYGIVFKIDEKFTYISCGGLLMKIEQMLDVSVDQNIFCCMNII